MIMPPRYEIGLRLMQDLLDKKAAALKQILGITENQEALLGAYDQEDFRDMIIEMGKQKQLLIDEVLSGDEFFQKTFEEYKAALDDPQAYRGILAGLQETIMQVTELDARIRLCEQRNQALLQYQRQTSSGPSRTANEAQKQQLLGRYKSLDKDSNA